MRQYVLVTHKDVVVALWANTSSLCVNMYPDLWILQAFRSKVILSCFIIYFLDISATFIFMIIITCCLFYFQVELKIQHEEENRLLEAKSLQIEKDQLQQQILKEREQAADNIAQLNKQVCNRW